MKYLIEDINKKPLIFYHGSKSDAFVHFNPSSATKGKQYWNPLGNGLYATNNPDFARNFGPNIHKIVIPPGCKYLRVNKRKWHAIAFGLVIRALKKAFKENNENYSYWESGYPNPIDTKHFRKLTKDEIIQRLIDEYSKDHRVVERKRAMKFSESELLKFLKEIMKRNNRPTIDDEKRKKITLFRYELYRTLNSYSPYEGLYEALAIVSDDFGNNIGNSFADILPKESDTIFGRYDFVIFTETNDVIGMTDKKGNIVSSYEIVIFNPELQKTKTHK